MGVEAPKIHQAARTNKFVAVKGERACKTSDARWERWKLQCGPLGDGFWHLRIFRGIAAENPNYSRKVFCQSLPFLSFWGPKNGFFETKADVWHRPPQNCRRMPQNSAEFGNPQPQKMQNWLELLPDCVQKKIFFFSKFAQSFEFLPFQKKWRQKRPRGFSDRWQTRLSAQFLKESGGMWLNRRGRGTRTGALAS